jgi:hypothetical protein
MFASDGGPTVERPLGYDKSRLHIAIELALLSEPSNWITMTLKWQSVLIGILVLAVSGCATSTHSRPDISATGRNGPLPPFKSPALIRFGTDSKIPYDTSGYWSEVLALLKLHGGYVEASELQYAFKDTALIRVRDIDDAGYEAFLVGNEKWYEGFFYLRFWRQAQVSDETMDALSGDFTHVDIPGVLDEHKECLDPIKAVSDLVALGWKRIPFQDSLTRAANNGPPPESFGVPTPIKLTNGRQSTVTFAYNDPSMPRGADYPDHACVALISIEGYR